MHFENNGNIFSKSYDVSDRPLIIDIANNHIKYEDIGITVTRNTTSNFDEPESLVVLECVDRLLTKGYQPQHLELEPHWKLGRGASGGFGDIWIRTKTASEGGIKVSSLMIIECKTYGAEFNSEWKRTLIDGGQLFSYFQQEQSTRFLCLYTSCFKDDDIDSLYHLINVQDNFQLLETNKSLASYIKARNNIELFSVWKDTYKCDSFSVGIFEDDIAPYEIGKDKFSISDLREVDDAEIKKLYNEFAVILRQHNVSGKENAFDKLVNLFLAKVVDETNNPSDLHFYWKGSVYDDDFQLQDRLQRLYRDGMKKFLGEEVTYIENQQIETAFRRFGNDPDATKDTILGYSRALKFFSDNDFSFMSVHNEKLFYQNAGVLKKVVQMLQNIRLKSANDNQNQFLGDLFEGFLTKGVKQSEGQFFTPMPIVRFIVSALPLESVVMSHRDVPRAIDYACGAGHFLTEYAARIKEFAAAHRPDIPLCQFYSKIYGIEKEYRLSKVSKVAAFMYGQDDINILYSDALNKINGIDDGTFDILVANPPYAVSGFLETLPPKEREKFELFSKDINIDKNNAIETFFIERASQLLASDGIAALVLPSTILTKSGIFAKSREILLRDFDIVAISEFGNKTFGKTSTSTVVLFLRRKERVAPDSAHFSNRVNSWFSNNTGADAVYEDAYLVEAYCKHQNYGVEDYRTFLCGEINESLSQTAIFQRYIEAFGSNSRNAMKDVCESAKTVRTKFLAKTKTKAYKQLAKEEKEQEFQSALYNFIASIEKEKLYFFILAFAVDHPVVVVKAPASTAEGQKFLGYKWSESKGQEGINYLHVMQSSDSHDEEDGEDDTMSQIRGINGIVTPLFNPTDLLDDSKINSVIRHHFLGEELDIPEDLEPYVSTVNLVDMIDFGRHSFSKELHTAIPKTTIESRFSHTPLSKIYSTIGGLWRGKKGPFKEVQILKNSNFDNFGNLRLEPSVILPVEEKQLEKRTLASGDIILEKSGGSQTQAVGRVAYFDSHDSICSFSNFTVRLRLKASARFQSRYVFHLLNNFYNEGHTFSMQSGMGNIKNLNMTYYMSIQIPNAPQPVQDEIIAGCDNIDMKIKQASDRIDSLHSRARRLISNIQGQTVTLRDCLEFVGDRVPYSEIAPSVYVSTDNMLQHCKGVEPYKGIPNIASVISYKKDDILLSNIRPYLRKIWLADVDGGCSPDVLVLRNTDKSRFDSAFIYYSLRQQQFFDHIMSDIKGAKMPRGKRDTIIAYQIVVPEEVSIQKQIAASLSEIYQEIATLESFIKGSFHKKKQIIESKLL